MKRSADWRGQLKRRFRWSRLRREWGRWCYQVNCHGHTTRKWWEWERR